MKIAALISRIILGVIFVFFGLNGFLHFLPAPLPQGLAGQFLGALMQSHYVWAVAGLQIIGGVLFLANRYVPLGLVLLGPLIVNIDLFHILLLPAAAEVAVVVTIGWIIIFIQQRQYFSGIFVQKT